MTIHLIKAGPGIYAVTLDGQPMGSISRERRGHHHTWKATGIQGRETLIPDRDTAARWVAGTP